MSAVLSVSTFKGHKKGSPTENILINQQQSISTKEKICSNPQSYFSKGMGALLTHFWYLQFKPTFHVSKLQSFCARQIPIKFNGIFGYKICSVWHLCVMWEWRCVWSFLSVAETALYLLISGSFCCISIATIVVLLEKCSVCTF